MNNLESLLRQNEINIGGAIVSSIDMAQIKNAKRPKRQTADKTATLLDFIAMVSKIVSIALKEKKVEFHPDEGKRIIRDPSETINHPHITYRVIERVPKGEIKPRHREGVIAEDVHNKEDGRNGRIYGQKFKALVQFDIIASEYRQADEVMNIFEDLILSYAHYFKRNGVAELFFSKHFTDENFDIFRQNVSVRSLRYHVEVEKLTMMFDSEIEDISITQ